MYDWTALCPVYIRCINQRSKRIRETSRPHLAFPRCLRLGGNTQFVMGKPDLGGGGAEWGPFGWTRSGFGWGVPDLDVPDLGEQLQKRLSFFR